MSFTGTCRVTVVGSASSVNGMLFVRQTKRWLLRGRGVTEARASIDDRCACPRVIFGRAHVWHNSADDVIPSDVRITTKKVVTRIAARVFVRHIRVVTRLILWVKHFKYSRNNIFNSKNHQISVYKCHDNNFDKNMTTF